MTLHIIGIGMRNEQSISVEGLELVKASDVIYLETYTCKLTNANLEDLQNYYGKEIIPANRELVESKAEETILKDAKDKEVCFLVIGDPFSATTHVDILHRARDQGITVTITNNASILNAIGIVGLELYKYGKTTSIPFENENVKSPYEVYLKNKEIGLHTLFLLDLRPDEDKYMSCKEAVDYLMKLWLPGDTKVVSCAHIGGDAKIKTSAAKDVVEMEEKPQCLIIPGELHFVEEEFLEKWN